VETRDTEAGARPKPLCRNRWVQSLNRLDRQHKRDVTAFFVFRALSILGGVAITALSGVLGPTLDLIID
jgi:hypothetical protein